MNSTRKTVGHEIAERYASRYMGKEFIQADMALAINEALEYAAEICNREYWQINRLAELQEAIREEKA